MLRNINPPTPLAGGVLDHTLICCPIAVLLYCTLRFMLLYATSSLSILFPMCSVSCCMLPFLTPLHPPPNRLCFPGSLLRCFFLGPLQSLPTPFASSPRA